MGSQKDGQGFDGFDGLISDVSEDLERARRSVVGGSATAKVLVQSDKDAIAIKQRSDANGTQGKRQSTTTSTSSSSGPTVGNWLALIGFVLVLAWLFNITTGNGPSETGRTAPTISSAPLPSRVDNSKPAASDFSQQDQPSLSLSAPPEHDEKPPVGTNHVLNRNQIRYCVSEDTRITAIEDLINNYSETEVDRFNALVNDYNRRCGRFQYTHGALEGVRSEVQANRASLEAEGLARLSGWRKQTDRSDLESPTHQDIRDIKSLVRAIQQQLRDLGYEPGSADGIAGRKTREAIVAFQAANGLDIDGQPTVELLGQLRDVQR